MTVNGELSTDSLHRTAKYFMDSGRAASHAEAMALLEGFSLTILVGGDLATSESKQVALLSLVNLAHRTLLGGVTVIGVPDCTSLTPLAGGAVMRDAVVRLGGRVAADVPANGALAIIGEVDPPDGAEAAWRLTWAGWRGGVVPVRAKHRLGDDKAVPLAPMVAAAFCVSEVFSYLAGDHPMAGRRSAGFSLWDPGSDWLKPNAEETELAYLPSRFWLIGLGNLGQAYCWALAGLPYGDRSKVEFFLQDFDSLAKSNLSTSVLTFSAHVGRKKGRMVADWLGALGFSTFIEERRFGPATKRADTEPGLALCGVDNALARSALEDSGFDLVVEAGLGAGPEGFRGLSIHTFPSARSARSIWSNVGPDILSPAAMPAYKALAAAGMDACGLATLASRTVGVPFVGLLAATLVVSELLRRLNGGPSFELASLSLDAPEDVDKLSQTAKPYAHGHVAKRS